MTDTFSSGFSTPYGQDPGESAGAVTTTLAELERKLRELERELTSIGRRRVRPETSEAEAPAAPVPSSDTGRLVDEQVEFHRPTPPAPAPADGERPRPTEAQLASLAELRRFRERLERFTRELLADYDAVLARAMSGVAGRVPSEHPSVPSEPPPASMAAPPPASMATPPPASMATPPPAPTAPPPPREPLFEGRVELGVGPFYDIGSLSAFEQVLITVPHVIDVSVRRFEASHAVVDLRLAAPVALVSELRGVLDTDFNVRQVAPGRIQLAFDDA